MRQITTPGPRLIVVNLALAAWLGLSLPVRGALSTAEIEKLAAADGAAGDEFGKALAISGDLAVVGAPFDDDSGGGSGAAYLFARNQGGADAWGQITKLTPADGSAADSFGRAVAISGDTVVVGAPFDDDACVADPLCDSGSVYVFKRNQGGADAWGQVVKLVASDAAAGDEFGFSVAIGNDTVVVGAHQSADAGAGSGSAYVFERNQNGAEMWGEVEKIVASDATAGDEFGVSVGITGDRIVVGALAGDGASADSGTAYVFERNQGGGDAWGQLAELAAADGAPGDEFGCSVALWEDTAVVGAGKDADAGADSGAAYVFERNQGGADFWRQTQKLTASGAAAGDELGRAVDIASNGIAVGAYLADNDPDEGAVYLFEREEEAPNGWTETARVTAADGAAGDGFGFSVALTSELLIAGSPADDDAGDSSGTVQVFARTGATWEPRDKVVAEDAAAADELGSAVAIRGEAAAVGTPNSNQNVAGIGRGAVYLFRRSPVAGGETWPQEVRVENTVTGIGDEFGTAVGIGGGILVVGARFDDDACPSTPFTCNSGTVRLYERNSGGVDGWGFLVDPEPLDLEAQDRFGSSVAIDGDTVVVGSPLDDDACPTDADCDSGSAYVLLRNQGGSDMWGQVAKLTASDADDGDWFGHSVAISGDTVVVGAPFDDACPANPTCDSGAVYVFERNQGGADQWGEVMRVTHSGLFPAGDQLGWSVDVDGSRLVAGATLGDADAAGSVFDTGAAFVFERNQGGADQWGEVTQLVPADAGVLDSFGAAVAIEGDRILVGSPNNDDACPMDVGCNSGSAYVFERNEGGADQWGQKAKLLAADAAAGDLFGSSVALDGSAGLVGAPLDDDACPADAGCDSGAAHVFRLRAPQGDLSIGKDDGITEIERLDGPSYVIQVTNNGLEDALGVLVTDVLDPSQFVLARTAWTCAPAPGSASGTICPVSGDAADLAAGVSVDLVAGDSLSFTVDTMISASAAGPIINTAWIATPTFMDVDATNDSATDTDHLLVAGACGHFEDRVISEQVIDTGTEIAACNSITLGPNLELDAPGALLARAGNLIRVEGDVTVQAGVDVTLMIDVSLLP